MIKKPEPYSYWFKAVLQMMIPSGREWSPVLECTIDLLVSLKDALLVLFMRLFLLCTCVISIPLVAYWCSVKDKERYERQSIKQKELIESITCLAQRADEKEKDDKRI